MKKIDTVYFKNSENIYAIQGSKNSSMRYTSIYILHFYLDSTLYIESLGQRYINGDPKSPEIPYLPLETLTVEQNRYYRFRTINSGFQSPFEISVDDVSKQ